MKSTIISVMIALIITSCDNSTGLGGDNPYTQEHIPWPSLADSPWPMHHGNPQSTGRFDNTIAPNRASLWEYETTGYILSSPVIDSEGNILFVSSYDVGDTNYRLLYLNAIDPNGALLWQYQMLEDSSNWGYALGDCSPLIGNDGTIYVGTGEGYFFAVNNNGSLKWKFQADESIYSISPTLGLDGTIYFLAKDGYLYALNPDGSLLWKVTEDGGFLWSMVPVFSPDGNNLYVPGLTTEGSKTLYALDISGTLLWSFDTGGYVTNTPLVTSQGDIFIGPYSPLFDDTTGAQVFMLNSNGKLIWKHIYHINDRSIAGDPAIDEEGNLYFHANGDILTSITYEGERRWQRVIDHSGFASPIVCDIESNIFVGTGGPTDNHLYAFNSEGIVRWKIPIDEDRIFESPAVNDNGMIYIPTTGTKFGENFGNIIAIK